MKTSRFSTAELREMMASTDAYTDILDCDDIGNIIAELVSLRDERQANAEVRKTTP